MESQENIKEKWADDVLQSLDGMQRAEPPQDLFDKITQQLHQGKAKIISMDQIRWIAAAIVLIIVLNTVAIKQYLDSQQNMVIENTDGLTLINDYSLYTD